MPSRVSAVAARIHRPAKVVDPFYESNEWRSFARVIKQQRGYVCEECGKDCSATPRGLIADHIVERKDGGADFDPLNTLLRCMSCHNKKTSRVRIYRNTSVA